MPKIQVSEELLYSLLERKPSFEELEKELETAKGEIDALADEEGNLKIELNDTNRPDLWTVSGLARHLNTYNDSSFLDKIKYDFLTKEDTDVDIQDSNKKIIVDKKLKKIRPYVCGFLAKGKTIDKNLLVELIQIQEKLCENFGQKRKAIAIGIYREDLIQWPIHYSAADPQGESFVPLDFSESMNLKDILQLHPKGKEYGHIISDCKYFPLLKDSEDKVLSMPPVINSALIGSVEEGNESLFIECTGTNLEQLMLTANILACDCVYLGFEITQINTEYPYEVEGIFQDITQKEAKTVSLKAPMAFQSSLEVKMEEIEQLLGESIDDAEVQESLKKMGVSSHKKDENTFVIDVPAYRNDFLHSIDVIEDIMIGRGLDNIGTEYPRSFTIGRLTDIEIVSRKVIQIMVGLGFQEMVFPYLGSRVDFVENIYQEEEWDNIKESMVQISNPISENYEFVRASVLPNLLEAERVSAHSLYPHHMCELGKVACIDQSDNMGTRTDTVMGFLIADSIVGFNDINSIIAAIFYYINVDWTVEMVIDSRFIEGRVAKILRKCDNGDIKEVGVFGEVHPRVLEIHNISMSCVAGEIIIDSLL